MPASRVSCAGMRKKGASPPGLKGYSEYALLFRCVDDAVLRLDAG